MLAIPWDVDVAIAATRSMRIQILVEHDLAITGLNPIGVTSVYVEVERKHRVFRLVCIRLASFLLAPPFKAF